MVPMSLHPPRNQELGRQAPPGVPCLTRGERPWRKYTCRAIGLGVSSATVPSLPQGAGVRAPRPESKPLTLIVSDRHATALAEPKPLIESLNVLVADQIDCVQRPQLCHHASHKFSADASALPLG